MCEADYKLFKQGEKAELDWKASRFTGDPKWLEEIPATLHYLGGDLTDHLSSSISIGQALNDLNGAVNPGTDGDAIFFIRAMRQDDPGRNA